VWRGGGAVVELNRQAPRQRGTGGVVRRSRTGRSCWNPTRESGLGLVVLAGAVEMDIAQMSPEGQKDFVASLGLAEPAAGRFIRAVYALIDLISLLTAGEDECRAWPIRAGTTAQKSAGKIHSDIERGFIRAEVMRWDDLCKLGSEAKCREAAKPGRQGIRRRRRRCGQLPFQRVKCKWRRSANPAG
jgi:hypothetical protein